MRACTRPWRTVSVSKCLAGKPMVSTISRMRSERKSKNTSVSLSVTDRLLDNMRELGRPLKAATCLRSVPWMMPSVLRMIGSRNSSVCDLA